jgi:geranylgeranyl pyrophosphate synthase
MSSDTKTLGKDIGNDIRNGKKTIIAVHCLTHAEDENKKILSDIFGKSNATDEEVHQVFKVFNDVGSVEYAKNKAEEYSRQAKKSLSVLKQSNAKQILMDLADYAMTREK